MKISPFAPNRLPEMPDIAGVRFSVAEAGIKYKQRTDLLVAVLDEGTTAAGVFTRSKTASAPVEWCRKQVGHGRARGLVVNSGNSNAFTGKAGWATVEATVAAAAKAIGCRQEEILVASTGVIGQPFDAGMITPHLPACVTAARPGAWEAAARAIMTTDTYPKLATATVRLGGKNVHIGGMAKGAGMIAPDLATMFTFIFTDAAVGQPELAKLVAGAADATLNNLTIDGDTSTSDTVLAFATGASGARPIADLASADGKAFAKAFTGVMEDLALQIVKDGEGLTKFVTLHISGAESRDAARRIGMSIGNSPLFKTALAGHDPNWGRIVMAIGKAGEAADRDRIAIKFGDLQVAKDGAVDPTYREEDGAACFKRAEIEITVDVGVGTGSCTVWTCDLTADYVAINADYRS